MGATGNRQQAFRIILCMLIVSACAQFAHAKAQRFVYQTAYQTAPAQAAQAAQGGYQECKCSTQTAETNYGNTIGRCFTKDIQGRFFCYVDPIVSGRGCCEEQSARFPRLCVSFSLCSAADAVKFVDTTTNRELNI